MNQVSIRIVTALAAAMLLAACGHMAPYSEHRGASVELYDIAGSHYLRVPYRVVVYDLIPRTYLDEEWIAVGASPSGDHQLSYCPPTLRDRYQQPRPMQGVVDVKKSEVHINLMFPAVAGRSDQDRPYKHNGTWTLIEVKGPPPTVSEAHRDSCS